MPSFSIICSGIRSRGSSSISGQRKFGGTLDSYRDYKLLRKAADAGEFGDCEVVHATSFDGDIPGAEGPPERLP